RTADRRNRLQLRGPDEKDPRSLRFPPGRELNGRRLSHPPGAHAPGSPEGLKVVTMLPRLRLSPASPVQVHAHGAADLVSHLPRLEAYVRRAGPVPLSRHPAWLKVLRAGLGHEPYCL